MSKHAKRGGHVGKQSELEQTRQSEVKVEQFCGDLDADEWRDLISRGKREKHD